MTPEQIKSHHAELTRIAHASPTWATDFLSGQTRLNSIRIHLQQKADEFYNANIYTFQPKTQEPIQ